MGRFLILLVMILFLYATFAVRPARAAEPKAPPPPPIVVLPKLCVIPRSVDLICRVHEVGGLLHAWCYDKAGHEYNLILGSKT